jgi:hypothetical protein
MKKLQVTITLGMEVPDNWELVEHQDGFTVIDTGDGKFLDMTFTPVITSENTENSEWTYDYDDAFADKIIDMVEEYDTEMEIVSAE